VPPPLWQREHVLRRVLQGAVAGAAGTTALNLLTYLDMTLRGRPASSTPEQTVERISSAVGLEVPGDADTRTNRVQGLGAVMGLATGVLVGAALGAVDDASNGALHRLPVGLLGTGVATAALVGANGPMAFLGISDPRTWTASDWASDLVPHLGYGLVTAFTYAGLAD
jgi:hypothetical protein